MNTFRHAYKKKIHDLWSFPEIVVSFLEAGKDSESPVKSHSSEE